MALKYAAIDLSTNRQHLVDAPSGNVAPPIAVAAALSALRVVATNADGNLVYADPSNPDHAFRVVGLLTSAVLSGATVEPLLRGVLTDSSWHWQLDQPIWLGSNGTLTQTPTGTAFLLVVGTAIDSQTLNFELQEVTLYG